MNSSSNHCLKDARSVVNRAFGYAITHMKITIAFVLPARRLSNVAPARFEGGKISCGVTDV